MKIPWIKRSSVKRDTSIEADIEVLFLAIENLHHRTDDLHDRLTILEKAFRDLSNDIRTMQFKYRNTKS